MIMIVNMKMIINANITHAALGAARNLVLSSRCPLQ